MSLMESGTGLFNTHVSTEDIREAIVNQMDGGNLGENAKFTIIGEGNGFLSNVMLVEQDTDNNYPQKFVLKVYSCQHVKQFIESMDEPGDDKEKESGEDLLAYLERESQMFHNREVNLYEIFKTWHMDDELLSPRIYFSKKFDSDNKTKGFIGIEYEEGTVTRHIYENATPNELYPILKAIATFQAKGLEMTENEKSNIDGLDMKVFMEKQYDAQGLKRAFENVKKIDPERLTEKAEKLREFGAEDVDFEFAANLNSHVGIKEDVLVHGDLWSTNVLWKRLRDGHWAASKLIDYQVVHMGNPAEDLVRLFLSTLSGAERRNHWEELLEKFYEYFKDALNGQKSPYTLEQLKESYRLYFVIVGIDMFTMFGPAAETMLSTMDDSEKLRLYREVLTEKAEALLEDMIHWHLYSLKQL